MKMKTPLPKTTKGKAFTIIVLILISILTIVLAQKAYIYYNPQTQIHYKIYEPTYLPEGVSISERTIRSETPNSFLWWVTPKVSISARAIINGDNYSTISNDAYDGNPLSCDGDTELAGATCAIHTTPNGVLYYRGLLYETSDYENYPDIYDKFNGQGVSFIKDGTEVGISVQANSPFSFEEWDKIIDSVQEVDIKEYNVLHAHPGP